MRKGIVPIFILLAVILIVVTGFITYQKNISQKGSPISELPPSSIVDQETYIDTQFGFSVKYPKNLEFKKDVDRENTSQIVSLASCVNILTNTPSAIEKLRSGDRAFEVFRYIDNMVLDIGESKVYSYPPDDDNFILQVTYKRLNDKVIGGVNWINLSIVNNFENLGNPSSYVLKKDSNYWSIITTDCNTETIDQILSTFQFTQ